MIDDPDDYVDQHRDQLINIIKHSTSDFIRALSLAALLEYGDDATVDDIKRDLERIKQMKGERGEEK